MMVLYTNGVKVMKGIFVNSLYIILILAMIIFLCSAWGKSALFATDFVTNSSSSSFVIEITVYTVNGKTISFSTIGSLYWAKFSVSSNSLKSYCSIG